MEIKVNMENLNESEREQLTALIRKGNKKPFEIWVPEDGEKCYLISQGGAICCILYRSFYKKEYEQGNIVKTENEAIFKPKQRQILKRYEDLALLSWGGEKEVWDGGTKKWYLSNDGFNKCFNIIYNLWNKCQGTIYFKSRQALQSAIDEIGEENIKKYVLEVE